jgi:hypothetical protein
MTDPGLTNAAPPARITVRELCQHPEVCGRTWRTCAGDIPASLALIAGSEARARELSNAYRRQLHVRKRDRRLGRPRKLDA